MDQVAPKPLIRDWKHYSLWWCFWVALFGMLQPVVTSELEFATMKAIQFGLGLAWGAVLAIIFTLLQNSLNSGRSRPLSWILAIATAVLANLVFFLIVK